MTIELVLKIDDMPIAIRQRRSAIRRSWVLYNPAL
jgi:hypothetical protein